MEKAGVLMSLAKLTIAHAGDDALKGKGGSEGGCGLPSNERLLLIFETTASQLLPLDLDEWRLSFMQDVHRVRLMVTRTVLQSAQTVKPACFVK